MRLSRSSALLSLGALMHCASVLSASFDVRVIDEAGDPVPQAWISIGNGPASGRTDAQGLYKYSGPLNTLIQVTKQGHERALISLVPSSIALMRQDGEGLVADVTLYRVREREGHAVMRVRELQGRRILDTTLVLPGIGEFGYDFERDDWLTPHGAGKQRDVTFVATQTGNHVLACDLRFGEGGDGIQTHFVLFHRLVTNYLQAAQDAPLDGYVTSLSGANAAGRPRHEALRQRLPLALLPTWNYDVNYFFRVRSSATMPRYGFIRGPISCEFDEQNRPVAMIRAYLANPGSRRPVP